MLKKHLIFLMLMVMAVAVANAGTWKMHNYYVTANIQNVYDTGDKVYYLNSNVLFQFDKATQTTVALSSQNKLSDNTVSNLFYDYERKLLFVTYSNSNIDVIDSVGNITNISAIKDAIVRVYNYTLDNGVLSGYTDKTINDITFTGGKAYVATGYGFVTIDESTLRVIDNQVLGQTININSVAVLGTDLMLILSNTYCYYGPVGTPDPTKVFNKYKGNPAFTGGKLFPIDDHSALVSGLTGLYHFDFSGEEVVVTSLVAANKPTCIQKTSTGYIVNYAGQKFYYTVDSTGKVATKASSVIGFATSDPFGDGTVWINDESGLHIENSADCYKMNSLATNIPHWLKYNEALNVLYVANSGPNGITNANSHPTNVVNTYDGTTWADATPYTYTYSEGFEFVINPLDSATYFRSSWSRGIFKVTNNVQKFNYTNTNSLMGKYKPNLAFDNYGNLWIASSYSNASCPVAVLTKDKVANNSVDKTDWFQPSGLLSVNTGSMKRSRFLISKLNNVKIYSDCDYNNTSLLGHILCWDNENEDPTVDNYKFSSISHFVDQNNQQVDWAYLCHMEEDANGLIWVGHTAGLFVFDPSVVFDGQPRATRPYLPDFNEGKGYLCEGYTVYDFGIDRNNCKWIGTNNGLYYVSQDGTTVYEHFTTENSDIPSNTIYAVECDVNHDHVYIVTDNGFAEYITNGDAAALNFDNVYAFPSPVEPDFTGMIKIANLMENTYVAITDHNGTVVAQMGPVMGSALWDGSGENGERLPTGVYNVYVAQGAQPVTTGTPQTTIMIIK